MEVKYRAHWSINLLLFLNIKTNKLSFREVTKLRLKTRVRNCLQLLWKFRDNSARISKGTLITGCSRLRLSLIRLNLKMKRPQILGIRIAFKAISTKGIRNTMENSNKKRLKEHKLTRWCKGFLKIRKLILKIYRRHLLKMVTWQGKRESALFTLHQTIARVTA